MSFHRIASGMGQAAMVKVIDNEVDLGLRIDAIIKEAMRGELYDAALDEKEKQDDAVDDLFGAEKDDEQGDREPGFNKQASDASDDDDTLKNGEVKMSDIVDRLNVIRSGRSLKDSVVKQNMEEYISGLSTTERVALLAFLKGIGQILTGEIPAQQAFDPAKDPASVHMHKTSEKGKETHHIKPNVIAKHGGSGTQSKKTAGEDTTPPIPIAAKRRK